MITTANFLRIVLFLMKGTHQSQIKLSTDLDSIGYELLEPCDSQTKYTSDFELSMKLKY